MEDEVAERADRLEEAVTLWWPHRADGHVPMVSASRLAGRLAASPTHVAVTEQTC